MANLAYDSNKEDTQQSTSNILAPSATPAGQEADTSAQSSYVSDGNPYGGYASNSTPQQPPQAQSTAAPTSTQSQMRKSQSGPTSGAHTNVQTYVNKNQQSSQKLGGAVEGKLQNTADLVRQNASNVNKNFNQSMDAGSLANHETAQERAGAAFNEAANVTAPQREFVDNSASLYAPVKNDQGAYSTEDQALVDANKARVTYGDKTTKDFDTESEAQASINDWNKQNPGYNQYGDQQQLSMSDKELSDILNAKYTGPTDLYQASGYNDLVNEFGNAQALQNQGMASGYKGELLKQTFSNPNTDYTLGQSILDDLLLGQGDTGASLKEKAKGLGNTESGLLSDEFNDNKESARQSASDRSLKMDEIKKGSRALLDETALNRERQVNDRIDEVVQNWDKYPDYYKERFQKEINEHDRKSGMHNNYVAAETAKNSVLNDTAYKDLKNNQVNLNNAISVGNRYNENVRILNDPKSTAEQKRQASIEARDDQAYARSAFPHLNTEIGRLAAVATSQMNLLQKKLAPYTNKINDYNSQLAANKEFAQYDPNSFNMNLSQIESEMLGVQGGEGLYDLLKNGGVDSLIRTAKSDNNRLISSDEQNQLSRLQSIAELANDYGSANSGLTFNNKFTDRDAAGTQSALDALDMDYLRNQLQGREKQFRDETASKIITGKGEGKGSSGGLLGSTSETATKYLDQNIGDLLNQTGGYRNMYEGGGVDDATMKQILGLSKGVASGTYGSSNAPIAEQVGTAINGMNPLSGNVLSSGLNNAIGGTPVGDILSGALSVMTGDWGNTLNQISSGISGSSSEASSKAKQNAYKNAQKDLKKKVTGYLNEQGVGNQLNVTQDSQKDLELMKLLGLLDTTNS